MRPHWWAVLAVSLSLLALVAAATSSHPGGPDHPRQEAAAARDGQGGRISASTPGRTTTTTSGPGLGSAPVTSTTVTPVTAPPGGPVTIATIGTKLQAATKPSSTVPPVPTPTTTTTTTTPSGGANTGGTPAQPAPQIFSGDLQQPYDATASIPFTGSGSMRITATWPTTPTLSLTVTCPGGSQNEKGSSSLSVVIADADGSCEIVLEETLVQFAGVSYTVTVVPSGA
jgi:hypothetical protein